MLPSAIPHTKIRSILVIDDEAPMLMGLRVLLERKGYNVTACDTALLGIKTAKEVCPDLILCDVTMPLMDGYKVREALSADPRTRDIPFLFLSARASQTAKLKGFSGGADDYLTKPFDPRELVARIQAVFRRQDQGMQAAQQEVNRQIERIQTEISHNLSHELRTPLAQILLSLDMALRNKYNDPDELKWFVETALSQSYRLNFLIDDLIFLSNYDIGRAFSFSQRVDAQDNFTSIIEQRQSAYKDKNIRVDVCVADGVIIHAPYREFRQAVGHLVDNALKFSPPMSTILVNLGARENGGYALTVTDYGMGIPVELHEKVFERFYQISQGDTRQYGGLGVGLTIARAVARLLGGDVVILPSERGCRVQMTLPPSPLDVL